jgi:hypothetical protein
MSITQRLIGNATVPAALAPSACAPPGSRCLKVATSPLDTAAAYVDHDFNVLGATLIYSVSSKNLPLAKLPVDGNFVLHTAPGEVVLAAKTEAPASVTFDANAAETYNVKGTVGIGVFVWHPHLVVVLDEVGCEEISCCRRVPGADALSSSVRKRKDLAVLQHS